MINTHEQAESVLIYDIRVMIPKKVGMESKEGQSCLVRSNVRDSEKRAVLSLTQILGHAGL